ncbi:B3 domain-containing protein REM10-like isoform X2 [Malania oleifera]|uniref:B3 domain-containing protein REM10-like isoform X2 n=1 Tax=Malania oleifera TaxID=397392 RepID=UPI0025AE26A5|nr:B3 domain-containing protein REM10-like isoform X2 [Malania oleifera]
MEAQYIWKYIPKDFARANNLCNKNYEIILRDQSGRSKSMKLEGKRRGVVYIAHGWSRFAVANGLKVGDLFMIELVKGGKKLLMNFYGVHTEGNGSHKQDASRA